MRATPGVSAGRTSSGSVRRVGPLGPLDRGCLAYDNNGVYCVIIMIRTQISLSPEEYDAAKREARRLGISLAELLRRS